MTVLIAEFGLQSATANIKTNIRPHTQELQSTMLLDTPEAEIGIQAPNFELLDPDGNYYKSSDLMGENGLVIAFICNHCPYVKSLIQRLVIDAKALKDEGINVVAINPNDAVSYPADSPEMMLQFANQHQFNFPYLIDDSQATAQAYKAVCTPDFFGFNRSAQLQYRGRLDNVGMGSTAQRDAELMEAMRLIASTNKGPNIQRASIGCSIKWKR